MTANRQRKRTATFRGLSSYTLLLPDRTYFQDGYAVLPMRPTNEALARVAAPHLNHDPYPLSIPTMQEDGVKGLMFIRQPAGHLPINRMATELLRSSIAAGARRPANIDCIRGPAVLFDDPM
jgi:hypothetical protein